MMESLARRLRTTVGRRRFLRHIALLVAVYVLPLLRWNTASAGPTRFLRPPGALSEPDFLEKCIRCGLCGDVCPNQCINYFDLGAGKNAGTPYIVPREQGCMLCMKCTQVCPSGSLQPIERELEDIQAKVKMRRAVLDPNLCYSYNMRTCGVCYRACPLQDVAMKIGMYEQPILIAENCVGCGNCERICFLILFAGKIWCYACPWDGLTSWLRRLSFRGGKEETFNLGWKWPKALRNIYPATILFVGLTWLELGYNVTMSPRATATLGLMMLGLVFIPGLLVEKKSFYRYGCLIGRVSGLYSMFSPVELRRRDADICGSCKTADCYVGNDNGYACPTGQYLKTMDTNTYCTMCAECVRTCTHDNVALNLRPFGTDLVSAVKPRKDEAYLALVLFSLTAFHGLTMTPMWKISVSRIQDALGVGRLAAFSLGMALGLALPMVIYAGFVAISRALVRAKDLSVGTLFVTYSYGLIPIALFYHLAHNVEHFVMESRKLTALISDPFGYDWDLFGTAALRAGPLFSLSTVWYLQVALIVIGHVFGIYVSHRQADRLFGSRSGTLLSQAPMILLMIGFSVLSLWLVKQPMEVRTAM